MTDETDTWRITMGVLPEGEVAPEGDLPTRVWNLSASTTPEPAKGRMLWLLPLPPRGWHWGATDPDGQLHVHRTNAHGEGVEELHLATCEWIVRAMPGEVRVPSTRDGMRQRVQRALRRGGTW